MPDAPRVVWKDGVCYVLDEEVHEPMSHILRELREIKREQKEIHHDVQDIVVRMKALVEQI